jgi:hypothetical protein
MEEAMRSRMNHTITSGEVYSWTLELLLQAKLVKDHGWRCTAPVVLGIVLRAAGRCISVFAACRDLANGPCAQAVMDALSEGLPKTLPVLERRLNQALTDPLPQRMRRRAWELAIDWHLQPYYGQPHTSRNELYYGEPKQGTTKFHAYASACIVEHARRYTVALTWVRRHESMVAVLRRLLARTREKGLKIKRVLVDRAFFNVPVIEFLQAQKLPFIMPVVIRGRAPKRGRKLTGLRWIKRQPAGWYPHTMNNGKQRVSVSICVNYRWYRPCKDRRRRHRKERQQRRAKLLFAVWRVYASPTAIREHYRLRFGIETSFRQMRQARIYTCTRSPRLRLFFLALALILRNLWVWIHQTRLAEGCGDEPILHLERLRFKRMLDWIVCEVVALFHDGSTPCVEWSP